MALPLAPVAVPPPCSKGQAASRAQKRAGTTETVPARSFEFMPEPRKLKKSCFEIEWIYSCPPALKINLKNAMPEKIEPWKHVQKFAASA